MKSIITGDSKFASHSNDEDNLTILSNLEKRLWYTDSVGRRHMNLEWFKTVPCANPI